tara:strand:+ start:655 stop:1302 length:648 start_codon:yes stop_codon:yes gene_type:complete
MIEAYIAGDIKELLKGIQEEVIGKFTVYLGGGLLRDGYCGKTPKDVDIVFIPHLGNEGIEVSYLPKKFYCNYNKRVSEMSNTSDMQARGVTQVVGLFNSRLSTPEVQFIVYEKHLTMEELAADFDINICQVVWSPLEDVFYATDAFIKGHKRKIIECLHDYDKVRTYDRYCRMEAKFSDYQVVGKPSSSVLPFEDLLSASLGDYKPRESTGSMVD